jgi:hypothetical protein
VKINTQSLSKNFVSFYCFLFRTLFDAAQKRGKVAKSKAGDTGKSLRSCAQTGNADRTDAGALEERVHWSGSGAKAAVSMTSGVFVVSIQQFYHERANTMTLVWLGSC